jgi:hypothetical protein
MSTIINKTDGNIAASITDGTVNQDTSLDLVGHGYYAYGQVVNTDLVNLMENFSNVTSPRNPISGQLWHDRITKQLKVFDGSVFRSINNITQSSQAPTYQVVGDLWWDTVNLQLRIWNGLSYDLVAPAYNKSQGVSGVTVDSVMGTDNITHVVLSFRIGGFIVGIYTKEAFSPVDQISNFDSFLIKGLNLAHGFRTNAQADAADIAYALSGNIWANIMPANANAYTVGSLQANDFVNGFTLGSNSNFFMKYLPPSTYTPDVDGFGVIGNLANVIIGGTDSSNYVLVSNVATMINTTSTEDNHSFAVSGNTLIKNGNLVIRGDNNSNVWVKLGQLNDTTGLYHTDNFLTLSHTVPAISMYPNSDVEMLGSVTVDVDLTVMGGSSVQDLMATRIEVGDIGIYGAVYASHSVYASDFEGLIGSQNPNLGYFTVVNSETVNSGTVTTDSLYANVSAYLGNLTVGAIEGGTTHLAQLTATSLNSAIIGNVDPQAGYFTDIFPNTITANVIAVGAGTSGLTTLFGSTYNKGHLYDKLGYESTAVIGGVTNISLLNNSQIIQYALSPVGNFAFNITDIGNFTTDNVINLTIVVPIDTHPFYCTDVTIDGLTTSVKWLNYQPTSGFTNCTNVYSMAILRHTSSATVLISLSRFI